MLIIEQLENQLSIAQCRHDAAIQEIGRLESRLQTHQFDAKNENEILKTEVITS